MQTVFFHISERPKRKALIRRGKEADDYFSYCNEVGSEIWGLLSSVKGAISEPAGFWLPDQFHPKGTSKYVQGVEVSDTYCGIVPEGMELLDLPPCTMMIFQGPAYDDDSFCEAIHEMQESIKQFKPETYGFTWSTKDGPRFQLEPRGSRGYIEGLPVRSLCK